MCLQSVLRTDGKYRAPHVRRTGDTREVPEHLRSGESLPKKISRWYLKAVRKLARNMCGFEGRQFQVETTA